MKPCGRSDVRNLLAFLLWLFTLDAAQAQDGDQDRIRRFIDETQVILSQGGPQTNIRLQSLYREILAVDGLAARVAPATIWDRADAAARSRFAALMLCRLALVAERQGDGSYQSLTFLGGRSEGALRIVALRLILEDGGQRTVIFELTGPPNQGRILDFRSEDGRLSVRMAEQILRDAAPVSDQTAPAAWIHSLLCR